MYALMLKIGHDLGKIDTCSMQQMEQYFFIIRPLPHY